MVVPFSAHIRIVESDPALCSLQEIYEAHCNEAGYVRDDPVVQYAQRIRSLALAGVEVSIFYLDKFAATKTLTLIASENPGARLHLDEDRNCGRDFCQADSRFAFEERKLILLRGSPLHIIAKLGASFFSVYV